MTFYTTIKVVEKLNIDINTLYCYVSDKAAN